jgi:dolichol-phosphate mannosyltransferase
MTARVLVVMPTYNEKEALPTSLNKLRATVPEVDVLVVDDGSPDGTGAIADEMAARDTAVHVLHRVKKQGIGPAYISGFKWALQQGYDVVVEMDADGSHRAEDLRALLTRLEDPKADLVLGSRWVPGGQVENWPKSREALSRAGNTYARIMLRLPLKDATGGFRAFRASTLESFDLDSVASQGYCFQVDMARRVIQAGGHVVEVPITFVERAEGQSKMSRGIVIEALTRVTVWGLQDAGSAIAGAARRLLRR